MFSPGSLGNYLQAGNKERSKAINEVNCLDSVRVGVGCGYFHQQTSLVDLIDTHMNLEWMQCIIHNPVKSTALNHICQRGKQAMKEKLTGARVH